MHPGQLRHRVTLQRPDATQPSGYASVARVPASREFLSGSSTAAFRAGQVLEQSAYVFGFRFRSDVRGDWRLLGDDGRVYQIQTLGDPDGRSHELKVFATEAI